MADPARRLLPGVGHIKDDDRGGGGVRGGGGGGCSSDA